MKEMIRAKDTSVGVRINFFVLPTERVILSSKKKPNCHCRTKKKRINLVGFVGKGPQYRAGHDRTGRTGQEAEKADEDKSDRCRVVQTVPDDHHLPSLVSAEENKSLLVFVSPYILISYTHPHPHPLPFFLIHGAV